MKSVTLSLLRLYPPAWRARYGEELRAVLDATPVSLLTLLDVLRGALDAHLHPELLRQRGQAMVERLRAPELTVFAAYIGFVVAGMGFQKLTEYDDFMEAGRRYPVMGVSFTLVEVGAVIALLAVLAGGLPIAYAALRYALARRRWDILARFAAPVVAFVVLIGYGFVAVHLATPSAEGGQISTTTKALALGLVGVFVLGAVASVWGVAEAIRRSEVHPRLFRFAVVPTLLTALAMAVMCVAVVVWGLSLWANGPGLFDGNDGLLGSSTALSWGIQVALMAVTTLIAVAAAIRAYREREAVQLR